MQDTPMRDDIAEREYRAGFARIMWFAEQAKTQGWRLTDRQLVHKIVQCEHAAHLQEKGLLPILGQEVHSSAWNHGQADALRTLLRARGEQFK